MSYKSGFVSLIGHPNVGKSTLLNSFLNEKIAITSSMAQTTRNVIRGIYTSKDCQIVFLDTPGIHKAQNKLGNYMNSQAKSSYHDVECVLLVTDAKKEKASDYSSLIEDIIKTKIPLIVLLNKTDLLDNNEIKNKILEYAAINNNLEIFPLSALDKNQTDELLNIISQKLPEGPQYYPEDMSTDSAESFLVSEIIREKIIKFTRDEIPHSVAINIEKMKMKKDFLEINALIVCERDSQKAILIGSQGSMIKRIGTSARSELEKIFDCKVRLETYIKVDSDWRNSNKLLKEFGYSKNDE